jgi:propionyl-CoA carboxylase beta chain
VKYIAAEDITDLHRECLKEIVDLNVLEDLGESHFEKFDGVYTGIGMSEFGKIVFAIQDFKYKGGSSGRQHAEHLEKAMQVSLAQSLPFLIVVNTGGARIQEGAEALFYSTKALVDLTNLSGRMLSIAIAKGTSAAYGAYLVSMCDFAFFLKDSQVFLTGPKVIESALGKKINKSDLGGFDLHTSQTGVATHGEENMKTVQRKVLELLKLFSKNHRLQPKQRFLEDKQEPHQFNFKLPEFSHQTYDVKGLISEILDAGTFHEIYSRFANNLITGFGTINQTTVAIIANQPKVLSGCLNVSASKKLARYVQICNSYKIPMIFLVDTPGFLPGVNEEIAGVMNYGSKALQILAQCKVPRITIAIRKMVGGGYAVMNSKSINSDYAMAWHSVDVVIMSKNAADKFFQKEEINLKQRLIDSGMIDEFIFPEQTRAKIISTLNMILTQRNDFWQDRPAAIPPI